jgi:GH25 family lysozyme M1 (1,4-beta-N-acetylmuramidase)
MYNNYIYERDIVMRKLFQHKNHNREEWEDYDEAGYDWDEPGEETEKAEYIEPEKYSEEEEYIEPEEYTEEAEYIEAGEETEEAEYPEAEEYPEEVEYIEDEEYSEDEEYLEDEEYPEGDEYSDDIYYMDDEFDDADAQDGTSKNIVIRLWDKFVDMSAMDKIMTAMGAAVIILAFVTAGVYAGTKAIDKELSGLADVGGSLQDVEVLGENGLMAIADAKLAGLAAAQVAADAEQEESKSYDESEYSKDVTVSLETVSVYKDLKIKFTNKSSGKLIANVPFTVTVKTADGKTETWSDDDMDGIIYKKNITAGTYQITVDALTDEKYSGYTLPTGTKSVEVKKDIAYEKVDVKNEIKKESEINVAKEDTAKNDTVVESTLQNTVDFVESTVVASTYKEVSKSNITDPMTLSKAGGFTRMAAGQIPSETAENTDNNDNKEDTKKDVSEEGAGKNENGTETPSTETPPTETPPTETTKTVKLDKTSATVYAGEALTITATLEGASKTEVSAVSSDSAIAEVSVNGTTVTVTGKAAGSATITVTHPDDTAVVATCAVTVKSSPKNDTTTKLKDNSGNQLYVDDNGTYREAAYADYYTFSKFYIKGDVKYTGWQTLSDGKVYYFTADGNKVTGEQVIQGAKYTFASDGSLVTSASSGTMGIDVSKWNGTIDWNAVKNSGVSYVIIRCGYRGSSQGALIDDPMFATNIKGATAAGLKVGVYFFTQAIDEVEAVEEASMVLDRIKGYRISYPIFLDVEYSGGRADGISTETRTAVCKAFCATIQNAGYTAGVYANKTWFTSKINASALSSYKIWLAQYAAAPTYSGKYDIWQYTSKGQVSGISGNVDMNLSYLGY